jgi:hypothetical protein
MPNTFHLSPAYVLLGFGALWPSTQTLHFWFSLRAFKNVKYWRELNQLVRPPHSAI